MLRHYALETGIIICMLKNNVSANVQTIETEECDLVVVDRKTLIKLVNALMSSLESSQTLDMIASQAHLDPPPVAEKRDQISEARTEIAKGMRSLKAGIEELPSVTMQVRIKAG